MSLLVNHMNMDPSGLRNGREAWRGPTGAGETEQRSKGELQPYLQQCTDAGFDMQVSQKDLCSPVPVMKAVLMVYVSTLTVESKASNYLKKNS